MKLDERIIKGKKYLDCFDTVEASHFIGKKGYFSNTKTSYDDLSFLLEGILGRIEPQNENSFCEKTCERHYKYFLPSEWVEQPKKKCRPFTNEEFFNLFDSGKLCSIRKKNERGRFIITEVYFNDDCEKDTVYVKLNHCDAGFAMRYLLQNDFEYFDGKEWQPFGIEK